MKSNFIIYILILLSLWAVTLLGFVMVHFNSFIGLLIFSLFGISWGLTVAGLIGPRKLKTRIREFQVWFRTKAVIFFPVHPYRAIGGALRGGIKEFVPTKERIKNFVILATITLVFIAIAIGVIFLWQYLRTPKEESRSSEIKISEEAIGQETTNWKVYKNEEYRYEIKYPQNWYFLEDACCPPPPADVVLNNYSDKKIELSQHQLEEGVFSFSISSLYGGKLDELGEVKLLKEDGAKYEYLTINGIEAIKFTQTVFPNQPEEKVISYYIVKNNSHGWRIIFYNKCAICSRIFSTFRFLE